MNSYQKVKKKFIQFVCDKNDIERKYDQEKQNQIKIFLQNQFNYFFDDDKKKKSEEDLKEYIKKQNMQQKLPLKPGHIAKLLRTIYKDYVTVLIQYFYPNMNYELKDHILENSYTHRLNENRLEQIKLFVGDKQKVKGEKKERELQEETKKKAIQFLIQNWTNPEFVPFFTNFIDAYKKLVEIRITKNKFIKIMRLSTRIPYMITFSFWTLPKIPEENTNIGYLFDNRDVTSTRASIDEVEKVGEEIMEKFKLQNLTDNPYESLVSIY